MTRQPQRTRFSFAALAALGTLAVLAAPALVGARAATARAQTYTVKNLGVLPGHASSCANAVNDRGQVVGYSLNAANTVRRAFLWTPGGTAGSSSNPQMQDLGTINGENISAVDINNAGQVVLTGNGGSSSLWDAANGLRSMNDPSVSDAASLGWTNVAPRRINEMGQVTGTAYSPADGVTHGFLWTPTTPNGPYGTLTDLGQPGGYRFFSPVGIGDRGQIVGTMVPVVGASGTPRVFLWTPVDPVTGAFSPNAPTGVYTDLGTLGGTSAVARDINDAGEIAGHFFINGGERGFARDAFGGMTALVLPSRNAAELACRAHGINNAAQVIGSSGSILPRAFVWDASSGIRDLNALAVAGDTKGFTLQYAWGINDARVSGAGRAQIVGQGLLNKVGNRAFLLTPR